MTIVNQVSMQSASLLDGDALGGIAQLVPLERRWPIGDVVQLPIRDIDPGTSIRVEKVSHCHVGLLAELQGDWPPILIRRADRTIVDGRYRYLAAQAIGLRYIECQYFEGDADAALIESIRLNTQGGLPLTLQDRRNAATRVLGDHQGWSDRRIAQICGLSPGTVSALRRTMSAPPGRPAAQIAQLDVREGADQRRRAVDRIEQRRRITEALLDQPDLSLRAIAGSVGGSPETVRKVKRSLLNVEQTPEPVGREGVNSCKFKADPALASTTAGAEFSAWFEQTALDNEWKYYLESVPLSRIYEVADEARRRSANWAEFAESLENRVRVRSGRISTAM
jgi:ParB-like chromosome segregation protein Spo0J